MFIRKSLIFVKVTTIHKTQSKWFPEAYLRPSYPSIMERFPENRGRMSYYNWETQIFLCHFATSRKVLWRALNIFTCVVKWRKKNEFLGCIGTAHEDPFGIYLLKVNNRNVRTRWKIYSILTIKTPEWRQWYRFGVFIINFEHVSHLVVVFLLLILNM